MTPEGAEARTALNLVRDRLEEMVHGDSGTVKDAIMLLVSVFCVF